jgi:hypothetical protein
MSSCWGISNLSLSRTADGRLQKRVNRNIGAEGHNAFSWNGLYSVRNHE